MTDSIFDEPIRVRCPKCGNGFKKRFGWFEEHVYLACPSCGASIDPGEYKRRLEELREARENIRRSRPDFPQ